MRSRRVNIGTILCSYSAAGTIFDEAHDLSNILGFSLTETNNIDVVFGIFSCMQNISLIEEVVEFPTVNFIERNPHRKIL